MAAAVDDVLPDSGALIVSIMVHGLSQRQRVQCMGSSGSAAGVQQAGCSSTAGMKAEQCVRSSDGPSTLLSPPARATSTLERPAPAVAAPQGCMCGGQAGRARPAKQTTQSHSAGCQSRTLYVCAFRIWPALKLMWVLAGMFFYNDSRLPGRVLR